MVSNSNEISTIPENIKKARNKKGFSQDRLSKMVDVVHNTIIKIVKLIKIGIQHLILLRKLQKLLK